MKNRSPYFCIKTGMIILVALCIIQTLTFITVGEKMIMRTYFETLKSSHQHSSVIGILDRDQYSESDRNCIKESLSNRFSEIYFTSDSIEWQRKYWDDQQSIGLAIDVEYKFPFSVVVFEGSGSSGYVETWETKYYWCLFTWIQIYKESTDQS